MVDSRLVAEYKIILDRDDAQIRDTCHGAADEVPGERAVVCINGINILSCEVAVLLINVLDPAASRLIIMGSCVDDAVVVIVVREIIALLT